MMKNILTAAIVAAVMSSGVTAQADLVYSNDFNDPGNLAANDIGGGLGFNNSNFSLEAADSDFSSQYLSIGSRQDNGNFTFGRWDSTNTTLASPLNTVVAFEWDGLYRDSDSSTYRTRLRGSDAANGNFTGNIDITQGNSTANTVQSYLFVTNRDTAAITLDATLNSQGNTSTIAANSWAIYQDGTLLDSGTLSGGPIDRLTLWHQGDFPNTDPSNFYLDNFAVFTNVSVVPEPSSLALLGLIGVAGTLRRRRA